MRGLVGGGKGSRTLRRPSAYLAGALRARSPVTLRKKTRHVARGGADSRDVGARPEVGGEPPHRIPVPGKEVPRSRRGAHLSASSGYVCPVDDVAEAFVVGVVVAPDDVPADHAGLFLVAGVAGAVEREIPQRGELGFVG